MRLGGCEAVSSALLFVFAAAVPYPAPLGCGEATGGGLGCGLLISEFYSAALSDDEYFSLTNQMSSYMSLSGWSVSDGEGSLLFLSLLLSPRSSIAVSFNSTSYAAAYGQEPEIALDNNASLQMVSLIGSFRLADAGDTLSLLDPWGRSVDSVSYGDEVCEGWIGEPIPKPRQGEVVRRMMVEEEFVDTNSSLDWCGFREYRYGYTSLEKATAAIDPGRLCAFVSPDCSLDVVVDALNSASSSVLLCSYEVSSVPVCKALLSAKGRGVDVRLFIDGNPAGGMSSDQVACISVLAASGVAVTLICGNMSRAVVQHFSALHSKYAVIDARTVIVLSENFVESGVPSDRVFGNRGWGVLVESRTLALSLSSMFMDDSRPSRLDVLDWREDPRYSPRAVLPIREESIRLEGLLEPLWTTAEASVTLIPSPDANSVSPFLLGTIAGASEVLVEQFQSDLNWSPRWSDCPVVNPLLTSIREAMRSGASCRALFDSSWFNEDRNSECAEFIESVSMNGALEGEARLMDTHSPYIVVHNKGLVIDGSLSVVSSNNWVYSSFARNRELAAIIDSPEVALYFSRAFELDWNPDVTPPIVYVGDDIEAGPDASIVLHGSVSDDRVVSDCWWDLNGDGIRDADGSDAHFFANSPGRYLIVMVAEDAWGNTAKDSLTVIVRTGEGQAPGGARSPSPPPSWLVPIALCAIVLLARSVLRSRPRKINLPRRDSH